MAHYAFLTEPDQHGVSIVTDVIVGKDEGQGTDWEAHYASVRGMLCKRTSYHTQGGVHLNGGVPFRLNYAGIGMEFRADIDGFVPPCPGEGWTLDEATGTWAQAE
jgi:hypothetical protein